MKKKKITKPKKIAFAAHTGNVMKSTLSQAMVLMCGRMGIKSSIACADVDMRSGLETLKDRFAESKARNNHKQMYKLINANSVQNAIDSHTDEELYIIDCPSPISNSIITLIKSVDCIIMPCPGVKDVRAAIKVMHSLTNKGISVEKILIVMTRLATKKEVADREYQFACKYLDSIRKLNEKKFNFKIFPEYFRELPCYKKSINMGNSIIETGIYNIDTSTKKTIKNLINKTMEY